MKAIFMLIVFLVGCEYDHDGGAFLLDALRVYNDGAPSAGCVVFEGDSNTDFISVGQHFPGAYNVAVKGSTTADVINRIDAVRTVKPSIIVLMVGTNNVWHIENGAGSYAEYYSDFEYIVTEYKKFCPRVVCVSVLPIQRVPGSWQDTVNPHIAALNATIKQIATDSGAEFLDEWDDFHDAATDTFKSWLNSDGIHLNDAGKAIHCRNIKSIL